MLGRSCFNWFTASLMRELPKSISANPSKNKETFCKKYISMNQMRPNGGC